MNTSDQHFIKTVKQYYVEYGRHDLPWRQRPHLKPYTILVSEMMLQQTQVVRVIPKYRAFIKEWGNARALAHAPLGDVLRAWQGLGYNRRAKFLHTCASVVTSEYGGRWPRTYDDMCALPGVGPYTAGAIMVFAYNQPVPILETNIRTVYLHHYYADQTDVSESELLEAVTRTLDTEHPREWYWALMDYGAYLKRTHGNPNSRAKSYSMQSRFAGSDRQIRGAIIRALSQRPMTRARLLRTITCEDIRLDVQLEKLLQEKLITKSQRTYTLPN